MNSLRGNKAKFSLLLLLLLLLLVLPLAKERIVPNRCYPHLHRQHQHQLRDGEGVLVLAEVKVRVIKTGGRELEWEEEQGRRREIV